MSDPSAQRDPEELLRAALERLVLLECHQAAGAPGATPRAPEKLESELRRFRERAESAESQRDRLFAHVLAAERMRESMGGPSEDPLDLASFIAELRAELAEVQRARDAAERRNQELAAELRESRAPLAAKSVVAWAAALEEQGLLFPREAKLGQLWPELAAGSAAERLVLGAVVRDLDCEDVVLREAALLRLAGLPAPLAAPVVAAALGRERDPLLLGKLLRLAGRLGVKSLLPLVEAELTNPDERVRAAAMLAAVRLAPDGAELGRAAAAESARVRRSAAVAAALCRPDEALEILEPLSRDPEAPVRQLVAACAASLRELPDPLLRRLGSDEAPGVRASALRALRAAPELSALDPAERRRQLKAQGLAPRTPAGAVENPVEEAPPAFVALDALEAELRSSLRGRTPAELAVVLGAPEAAVARAVSQGLAEGRLVRRGQKLYVG